MRPGSFVTVFTQNLRNFPGNIREFLFQGTGALTSEHAGIFHPCVQVVNFINRDRFPGNRSQAKNTEKGSGRPVSGSTLTSTIHPETIPGEDGLAGVTIQDKESAAEVAGGYLHHGQTVVDALCQGISENLQGS